MEESAQQLEDIAELMRLKETNPAEFDKYVQMAADAAKLAQEQPDVLKALMQDEGAGGDPLTAARVEQRRALNAASELSGANGDDKGGINLPTGGTLGAGGTKAKTPGIMISPRPGFVIKTKLLDTSMKVFINVCQHERISESGMVKRLDKDGVEVEGLNIPMSVGPPSVDKDNAGDECIVYDVIINPKTVEECRVDKTGGQRDWLCHLSMQSVMTKHDCRLDPKYKLPKLTFKGSKENGPAQQRIRDDSAKPQITDVTPTGGKARQPSASTTNRSQGGVGLPAARPPDPPPSGVPLMVLASSTTAVWTCKGAAEEREVDVSATPLEDTVRMPVEKWPDSLVLTVTGLKPDALAVDLLAKVRVQTSAYVCTVEAPGHHSLQVRLPYAVQPDTASARANAHEGVVIVSLSVDRSPPSLRADAGSKPWLLSHALGGGQKRPAAGGEGGLGKLNGGVGSGTLEGASDDDGVEGTDELPEDRFHLRLPKGVNQYTGAVEDDRNDDQDLAQEAGDDPIHVKDKLPEDRFHQADIVSQHMIDTREKQRLEKIERAEEERKARKKQPEDGVEYVDFDDYRAGGRLGPPAPPQTVRSAQVADPNALRDPKLSQAMATAARVLSGAVNNKEEGDVSDVGSRLSAPFWSDLLD